MYQVVHTALGLVDNIDVYLCGSDVECFTSAKKPAIIAAIDPIQILSNLVVKSLLI